MAEDANQRVEEIKNNAGTSSDQKKESDALKKKRRGFFSRIWHGIFRKGDEDFEKKLQYLSKEEASVHARMKRRTHGWRKTARGIIVTAAAVEAVAVAYAIMTTRSQDLDWKMRAVRVFPMFLLPAVFSGLYWLLASFTRMREHKDQKTLERLRAERQAKINELKERTNYYMTQQLIERYDTDPAAKAAAASVLASKLGADSGLKVYVRDDSKLNAPVGKSSDVQLVQSNGLRNRRQQHGKTSTSPTMHAVEEVPHDYDGAETLEAHAQNQTIVEHHPSSGQGDGSFFARVAALLVGEDPTQCYALICGSCHRHNGLARKEDFPYITYYCPHCHALNRSRQQQELALDSYPTNAGSPTIEGGATPNSTSANSEVGALLSPLTGVPEKGSLSEMPVKNPVSEMPERGAEPVSPLVEMPERSADVHESTKLIS